MKILLAMLLLMPGYLYAADKAKSKRTRLKSRMCLNCQKQVALTDKGTLWEHNWTEELRCPWSGLLPSGKAFGTPELDPAPSKARKNKVRRVKPRSVSEAQWKEQGD